MGCDAVPIAVMDRQEGRGTLAGSQRHHARRDRDGCAAEDAALRHEGVVSCGRRRNDAGARVTGEFAQIDEGGRPGARGGGGERGVHGRCEGR